jgi:hypothetical protein
MRRGRVELLAVIAAYLALSLALVDWWVMPAYGTAGSFAYQVVFRFLLPVIAAVGLWAGRRWAWWALVGLLAIRALGEFSVFRHYGRDPELGWQAWPVQRAGLLAAGYAALALWVALSGELRGLSCSRTASGR